MSEDKTTVDTVKPAFYKIEGTNFTLLPLNEAGGSSVRLLKELRRAGERDEKALADDPDGALETIDVLQRLVRSLVPRTQRAQWDNLDPSINEIQEAFSEWSKAQGVEQGK